MSEAEMRQQRISDFDDRAAEERTGPRRLPAGGAIVTVHPLADEALLLAELGMSSSECVSVDGYWAINGDVVFLQVQSALAVPNRSPGVYGRLATYPPKHVNLVAVVEESVITSAVLEREAARLERLGWDRATLGDSLIALQ